MSLFERSIFMAPPPQHSGEVKKVMISSTALDLPQHRKEVRDACLRQGMFPIMMEYLPASDTEAIAESLRMVNEADIYLGVFADRYGHIPQGRDISITEMEYNRAVERGIPRLIFLMHEDHLLKPADVERDAGADKLEDLKKRLKSERVVNFFKSPNELQALVINSLSRYRQPDLTAFHYVSDIPAPPEPYIAHPYTLLQTSTLIGRQAELNLLNDWVTKPRTEAYRAHILNIVAIGGMGKSALTWKWFNDIAPHEMQSLAGRLWWSFYESDASFENFIIRTLAYVSKRPKEGIQQLPPPEREAQLLAILDREPYLIILDGLERLLIAYSRMDAARMADDDLDQRTANIVARALGLPEGAAQSFTGQRQLRKTADPRVGNFLRKLANIRSARILVSTRLYPAELQDKYTGDAIPGTYAYFLTGLKDDDALELWSTFSISGVRDELLQLFRTFNNHPLLIRALAGEVKFYRPAPGNFERWRGQHKDFNPFHLPQMYEAISHVLKFALLGLDENARKVLHIVAAFRMPATYDTLVALLVGDDKSFRSEDALVAVLSDLEDRGLLGWDRRANRYDLHPIVRSVTWGGLDDDTKYNIHKLLYEYFDTLPTIDELVINSLEDLTTDIELFNALIGLEDYSEAFMVLHDRLGDVMLFRLSTNRQLADLLESLFFPDGLDQASRWISSPRSLSGWNPLRETEDTSLQTWGINTLAIALKEFGQPKQAAQLFRRAIANSETISDQHNTCIVLDNLSSTLYYCGELHTAEVEARRSLLIARARHDYSPEAISLQVLGLALAARGATDVAKTALQRGLQLLAEHGQIQAEGVINVCLAWWALWMNNPIDASQFASRSWELAQSKHFKTDLIRATLIQGIIALSLGNLASADERLHRALTDARTVNYVEEELPALIGLAELCRWQDDLKAARELLEDVWEPAERGPYPLFHADACNVLVQIERDAGNREAAIQAAMQAYRLAWCDGPPFAYHWGLQKAKAHLAALSAPEPVLPPFDASKYEPMPEVEIDPPDEENDEMNPLISPV
jgi:tetratricopeptide (TPR) repeat protein